MSLFVTGSGEVSRYYVSGVKEATIGASATLSKSFYSIGNTVNQKETHSKRKGVTGYQNAIAIVREKLFSGGAISDNLYPDIVNWCMRMVFGAAPTNASVSPSSTVYTHTWAAITSPPSTFSMIKQLAGLSGFTELMTGLGISEVKIKSVDGTMSIEIKIDGLGSSYTLGVTEPSVTVLLDAANVPFIGTASTLLVDDVEVGTSLFAANWEVTVQPGFGLLPTGGSRDGSVTRFDKTAQRSVKASLTLIPTDRTLLTEWVAQTHHKYEFRCYGPVIDVPNSLNAMLKFIIPKGRTVDEIPSHIGNLSTFMLPVTIEGIIDLSGGTYNGQDFAVITQDLAPAP